MQKILWIVVSLLPLFMCSEKSKVDRFKSELLINQVIDSLAIKDSLESSYMLFRRTPDGLGEIVLQYYSELYNKNGKEDSTLIALSRVLFTESNVNLTFHSTSKWKLITTKQDSAKYLLNDNYSVLHITNPSFYNDKNNACVYISYLCGKQCGKGYVALFEYIPSHKTWRLISLRLAWN